MWQSEEKSSLVLWSWGIIITLAIGALSTWNQHQPTAILLLVISGVWGLVIIIYTIYRPLKALKTNIESLHGLISDILHRPGDRRVEWPEFLLMVAQLTSRVAVDGFLPQIVVGVGRGGSILAGMVAGYLGNKPVLVVDTDWTHEDRPLLSSSHAALAALSAGTRVLCVTADQFTGTSFRQVTRALSTSKTEYRLAVLWHHAGCSPQPHYFVASSAEKPRWPFRIAAFKAR